MPTLLTSWFGAFLVDDEGNVLEQALFPDGPDALAEVLLALDHGGVVDAERKVAPSGRFGVLEDRLLVLEGAFRLRDEAATHAEDMLRQIAASGDDFGFADSLMQQAAIALGRAKVREASTSRDLHVMQAVEAIDENSAQANVIMERLREWYALHFPELVDRVERNEELAGVIAAHGSADAIRAARDEYDLPSPMGAPIEEADEIAMRALARSASTMYATRAELEKYVDETMPGVAPNLTRLVGAVLAARLMKTAGGLRRLATMPSGTIQTLGAEKALFRHIKEGSRPPKHGILFNHPTIHRAPRHQRGPLARALAGKIALAARGDLFTKNADLGAKLVEDFERRTSEIRVEHARPSGRTRTTTRAPRGPPPGRGGGRPQQRFQSRGPPGRGPPRGGGGGEWRGPPRDARGPPREQRGPPRGPPREGGGPPREWRGPPRGPPSEGRGPPRGPPPEGRGPPRGDERPRGPPRDDRPRGPPSGGRSGPPAAFRGPPTRDQFEERRRSFHQKKRQDEKKGKRDSRGGNR